MSASTTHHFERYRLHTLTKGKKSIRVYEMVHIGPSEFYEKRQAAWERDYRRGWDIHCEGMRGAPFSLQDVYAKIAHHLGFVSQPKPNVPHKVHDLTYQDFGILSRLKVRGLYYVLNLFGKLICMGDPKTMKDQFMKTMESGDGPDDRFRFLLDKRNKHAVQAALATPRNVSMIWGAMHAPGIITLLLAEGYHLAH